MKPDWPQVSSKARRSIGQFQKRFRVLNIFYNLFSCCLMILLLPAFIFLFLIVNLNRYFWLVILKKKYPNLEFINSTSVRSTVDNPRNPGILTVLLQVKGSCNIHMFKTQVQRDLLNRTKNGQLVFPHLRTKLSSVWGWYAWDKETASNFNIDNHITITQPVLEDSHVQKYISEFVSKYMNPDHPPWHLKIVPSSNKFFVLIRLHHLYLSEEHIGLGDILLLEPEHSSWSNEIDEYLYHENLLAGTFKTPVAIPQVYQHICECFSNFWNELVSVYDPIENPKIQISPTIKTYMIIILITMVSVMKEYLRTESSGIKYIIRRETQRRFITKRLLWRSILVTINPLTSIKYFISWSWWFIVMSSLQILRTILHIPQYIYWIFLSYHVFRELLYLTKIVFSGPRVIFEEIFISKKRTQKHHLQTVSLCGRKSISWSNPVPLKYVQEIHEVTGASSCEILLSALSASLGDYFRKQGFSIPRAVLTTSRFIPQELLLSSTPTSNHDGGFLCLNLPICLPDRPLESLIAVQESLQDARSSQTSIYLASLYKLDHSLLPWLLPSAVARILLYVLSRKYAVTVTQVDSISTERNRRRLLWGQEVENLMYWRPPQAKISISLTLMTYGESVRLGVMSDAQLSPQYSVISSNFTKHIRQLGRLCGVNGIH